MRTFISLLLFLLFLGSAEQLLAQTNTQLTPTRLRFNEGTAQKAYIWWTGTDLIFETDETGDSDIGFDAEDDIYWNTNDINRMQLFQDGKLSLGASTPVYGSNLFSINGNIGLGSGDRSINFYEGSSRDAFIRFDTRHLTLQNDDANGHIYLDATNRLYFQTGSSGSTRMMIENDGNIGIGNDPISSSQLYLKTNNDGYGINIRNEANSSGNAYGLQAVSTGDGNVQRFGVYGSAISNSTFNTFGVYGISQGSGSNSYGVYGFGSGGASQNVYGVFGQANTSGLNWWAVYAQGDFYHTGSFQAPSDKKLKQNIKNLPSGTLEKVMQLKPKSYEFRTTEYDYVNLAKGEQIGFLSQDVEKVFPELVEDTKHTFAIHDGKGDPANNTVEKQLEIKSMSYLMFIPIAIKAIQEQQTIVEQQKMDFETEINALKAELAQLKALIQSPTNTTTPTQLDDRAQLEQNAPNPFHQTTSITYFIPETTQQAALFITDLNGQFVKEITIDQIGQGTIDLAANSLSAGIYQYSLILDGAVTATKQMVLTQ